jgi:hypothetical protein
LLTFSGLEFSLSLGFGDVLEANHQGMAEVQNMRHQLVGQHLKLALRLPVINLHQAELDYEFPLNLK